MIFDHGGNEISRHQLENTQIMPQAGWVEHDPTEIWQRTQQVISGALEKTGLTAADMAAVGITNQRETTIVWDKRTGKPYGNALVWQDTRTAGFAADLNEDERGAVVHERSGLPPSAYFSGGKLKWILDNVPQAREDAEAGYAAFGTPDSWVIWWLTGGPDGGLHMTDVTNASRTMLMNLQTLDWDDELLTIFGVPRSLLPEIRSSSEVYATTRADGPFGGEIKIAGDLGDQHAAMVGQLCLDPGDVKNTYGTGNFLLLNTGTKPVQSKNGLLTTVGYKFGDEPAVYALEGSIAVTGSSIQWLRDQLGIINESAEVEALAASVPDNGGVSFVPAFSGLFAPHWRSDARGVIVGLSRFNTKAHIARAALEAICYQSKDVVDAMVAEAGLQLNVLRVDGGVTMNDLCMQTQADILGISVSRPKMIETTALGAAYAAGLAVGYWADTDDLAANWQEAKRWEPQWDEKQRETGHAQWSKAIERTLNWVEV